MADKKDPKHHGVEANWIRELAGILEETGLTEIEIENDEVRMRVSRQGVSAPSVTVAATAPTAAPVATAPPAQAAPAPAAENHAGAVKSPMVGTAYLSPSPGAPAFATEGATVTEGQTILIIEAMKTMNPIAAPRSGKVTKIMVTDAQPVEFDEPLIIIE